MEDVKTKYPGKEVYGVFVAKGFDFERQRQTYGDYLFFQVNSLVYLLYKRIRLGKDFTHVDNE